MPRRCLFKSAHARKPNDQVCPGSDSNINPRFNLPTLEQKTYDMPRGVRPYEQLGAEPWAIWVVPSSLHPPTRLPVGSGGNGGWASERLRLERRASPPNDLPQSRIGVNSGGFFGLTVIG